VGTTLVIIWIIATSLYLRASFLAQGKVKTKLFRSETFLLEQKITAVLYSLGAIVWFLMDFKYLGYLFLANLIVTFLFYLQPTPRTTKKLLYIFLFLNAVFATELVLILT